MRGDGTPKGAPCNRPRLASRIAGKQGHTATPLSVPPRRLLRPWGLTYRHRREQARHPGRLPRPSPAPSQPLKAEPRSGLGRLPKAPRCHVCETQPQAPHPTGLGYPAPAKLSLCPTSERLMKRPLIGQDVTIIRAQGRAGIGIHSQVRERSPRTFVGKCAKLSTRHGRACPGHPRLTVATKKERRGCPRQARA
jgi:hypothetical protein